MAEKKQKKRGRPVLPQNRAKQDSLTIRLQPGEKAAIEQAAKKDGIVFSEWIRRALKTALDRAKVLL
jgi:hypothetical protein